MNRDAEIHDSHDLQPSNHEIQPEIDILNEQALRESTGEVETSLVEQKADSHPQPSGAEADEVRPSALPPLPYPLEQVIEKVLALPEWTPGRLFGVLFPLWDVDAAGFQGKEQPYSFFEKFIERGIAQAGLTSKDSLAELLGLGPDQVERVLLSLEAAGRLVRINGQFHLSPLAVRSVQEGKKYVAAQTYLKLLFEGYYSRPLPNAYYDGLQILSSVEAEDFVQAQRGTRCPFYRLYSFRRWSPLAIKELALREDRTEYHIPTDVEQLSLLRVSPAYLPMYIVEATKPLTAPYYMVFTAAHDGRDEFFEKIVNSYAEIMLPLSGEEQHDVSQMWATWRQAASTPAAQYESPS